MLVFDMMTRTIFEGMIYRFICSSSFFQLLLRPSFFPDVLMFQVQGSDSSGKDLTANRGGGAEDTFSLKSSHNVLLDSNVSLWAKLISL